MNWKKYWLCSEEDITGKFILYNQTFIALCKKYQYQNNTINITIYETHFYYNELVT